MELYMARPTVANSTGASALGYLKSQDSTLHVDFRLARTASTTLMDFGVEPRGRKQRKAFDRMRKSQSDDNVKEVSVKLHQDLGTLSSERGDTGRFVVFFNGRSIVDKQVVSSGEAGAQFETCTTLCSHPVCISPNTYSNSITIHQRIPSLYSIMLHSLAHLSSSSAQVPDYWLYCCPRFANRIPLRTC